MENEPPVKKEYPPLLYDCANVSESNLICLLRKIFFDIYDEDEEYEDDEDDNNEDDENKDKVMINVMRMMTMVVLTTIIKLTLETIH